MSKSCEVCSKKIGFLDQNIKTKDKKFICENCYNKVFENTTISSLVTWPEKHTFNDFKELLNTGTKIDLKQAVKEEKQTEKMLIKADKEAKKEEIQTMKNKFKSHNAAVYDHLHFDPVDHEIMQDKTLTKAFSIIPYSDIVGYTPIEKGHSDTKKHGITRAVVGGALAGPAGAIVGASTGGKQFDYIDNLGVNIALKNNIFIDIKLLRQSTKQGLTTKLAYDEFYSLCSLLDGIISENSHQSAQKVEIVSPNGDLTKQLRDLKELVDDGIITQEEFDTKKKQLLSI